VEKLGQDILKGVLTIVAGTIVLALLFKYTPLGKLKS
jgi:hypothetical protein